MVRVLLRVALLVSLGTGVPGSGALAEPARPLRYVTFNLLHGGVLSGLSGNAQDLDRRLELAAAELQALGADIVGLQEASVGRGRGNVAARLAARLGFHHVHAPAGLRIFSSEPLNRVIFSVMNFTEGPAILSRFPIAASEAHDLPRCGGVFDPRVLLYAELDTPWGRLGASSTHTSHGSCEAPRVAELVGSRRGRLPAMLMGDFNAVETAPTIAALTGEAGLVDVFRAANPEAPGLTVWQRVDSPVPTVARRVDYLFLVPGADVPGRIVQSRVVLNTPARLPDGRTVWPSDHYGVLAEVEVFGQPPEPGTDGGVRGDLRRPTAEPWARSSR